VLQKYIKGEGGCSDFEIRVNVALLFAGVWSGVTAGGEAGHDVGFGGSSGKKEGKTRGFERWAQKIYPRKARTAR
jgi:hypothetical protein